MNGISIRLTHASERWEEHWEGNDLQSFHNRIVIQIQGFRRLHQVVPDQRDSFTPNTSHVIFQPLCDQLMDLRSLQIALVDFDQSRHHFHNLAEEQRQWNERKENNQRKFDG